MMYSSLVSLALVAGASAQRIALPPTVTLPPSINLAVADANDAAACSTIVEVVPYCLAEFGGADAFLTAADDEILACACCTGSTNIASAYSACSTYLVDALPGFETEADAYGDVYTLCEASASCGSSAGNTRTTDDASSITVTTTRETSSTETEEEIISTETDTELPELVTRTSDDASLPTACNNMIDIFTSCIAKTRTFEAMPFISQAPCYCCETRGNSVVWADTLDENASECADWAVTGEPMTIYEAASRFQSFCSNFSNACDDATATDSETTATETDTTTETGSDSTTETDAATETEEEAAETSEPGAGASLRIGAVSALLGAAALLVAW